MHKLRPKHATLNREITEKEIRMTLSEELTWRGFVNQMTFADITELDKGTLSFYFGVDPSADGMQIGNLAAAMMVRHFIEAGHKAYLLVGGATGMIGDPDGKSVERALLSIEDIERNKQSIAAQYRQVFAGQEFKIVDNNDWFKDINYIDFLRMVGKNVPLSSMLGREFIQSRLGEEGSGISYAEFSYSLIQGYDFLHLNREFGVTLQVCGSDQWGNSIAGVDLIRRIEAKEAHVYSVPLVMNKATGKKFGKSEEGAVWLDETKTSVYQFYQFWLNTEDEATAEYAKIFTLLNQEQIHEMETQIADNPSARQAQKTLAREVTTIVHGAERAASAERVTDVLFGNRSFTELSADDLTILEAEIPTVPSGQTIVGALVGAGFVSSNGEARRLIDGGAISLNGQKVSEDSLIAATSLVKKGKNGFILVKE